MIEKIKIKSREKGFSLIEILVASAIGMVILYETFSFFVHQQNVFRQQTEQAEKQANLRIALYYLSKDIANAGYTGTPWGVELALYSMHKKGVSFDSIPVRSVKPISYSDLAETAPVNQNGQPLDAIEIWGNFSRSDPNYTHLVNSASAKVTNIIYANTVDGLFAFKVWDEATNTQKDVYPTGMVIGSFYGKGDYLAISSVDVLAKTVSSSDAVVNDYAGNIDEVAPVLKRVYFVREETDTVIPSIKQRWLVRRDYYFGQTLDHRLASGIQDFQILYDAYDPATGAFAMDIDPSVTAIADPCLITAVNIRLQAMVQTKDMKVPMLTTLSRKVKLMNHDQYSQFTGCQ